MTLMQAMALEASIPSGTLATRPTLPSRARRSRLGVWAASSEVRPRSRGRPARMPHR